MPAMDESKMKLVQVDKLGLSRLFCKYDIIGS